MTKHSESPGDPAFKVRCITFRYPSSREGDHTQVTSPVINKFLVAIATFIAALATTLASTPDVAPTTSEWLVLALVFLGALGVYGVANAPKGS